MDDERETVPPEISAKATQLLLDAVAAILSADEHTRNWVPVKGLLIYEFMREDGQGVINCFGTDGVWSTEAIGLCEVAKRDLLEDGFTRPDDA